MATVKQAFALSARIHETTLIAQCPVGSLLGAKRQTHINLFYFILFYFIYFEIVSCSVARLECSGTISAH